jgi:hypothetical protein
MGVFDDATFHNIGSRMWVHEVMIKRIVAATRRGERDVERLRAGLIGLRKPNHQIVGEGEPDSGVTSPTALAAAEIN